MEQADEADSSFDHGGSPLDIWRIVFSNTWLLGAMLAVTSAALESVGVVLQKKAQYKIMGDNLGPSDPKPGWPLMIQRPLFWIGLSLYLGYSPVNMLALKYAPETTVTPINSFVVVINTCLSFGVLYERFSRRDITASCVCIICAVAMNVAMSQTIPGHLEDFPVGEVLQLSKDLLSNVGFAAYLVVWLALFALCLYTITFVSMQNVVKPFAVPLLIGLLRAFFHFMSRIVVTVVSRSGKSPEVWRDPLTYKTIAFTAVLYVLTVYAMSAGVQLLPCRFFVPAMFVACQTLTVIQDLLFFRAWEAMTGSDLTIFVIASVVSLVSIVYISPEQRVISSPDASGLNTPLLSPKTDAVRLHHSVLAIMDEYQIRKPSAPDPGPLKTIDMSVPISGTWRLFPVCICSGFVALPTLCWIFGYPFYAFTVLTVFSAYQGWKMGAHIALFAYVGLKKMAHFDNADFQALYRAEQKDSRRRQRAGPRWEDVLHFVVLPNYKEDLQVLRLAIRSVAASAIARTQIGLILAMEAREEEASEKAAALMEEFRGEFLSCDATFHPVGLPGEVPGKSANTRWAAAELLEKVLPERQLNLASVIITVGDADSEFHPEYFAALSYYFIHAGGEAGQVPERYITIWQPPILHFKNYITQPAVVRLASFISSEHELANLADPNATRVPYSTYSISAVLAQDVKGWDPDWISEDWHMALKCFLATAGHLKISPIFLPILNYAPEGDNTFQTIMARWVQAKRHALGFSEMVYLQDHVPRVLRSIEGRKNRVLFLWRLVFLWVKLLMIHLFMAVFIVIAPLNGVLIAYFASHEVAASLSINSWTFLINCVFQSIGLLGFIGVFLVSVLLYEGVKHRIDGSQSTSILWRSRLLQFALVVPQSLAYFPVVFAFGSAAEWIAAIKTARTHKFEYAVALKPKLKQDG